MLPGEHGPWEAAGTINDVATIARGAERLGYDFVTCSEHTIVPRDVASTRGSRYWDPLATFGYLAAVTTRLRFATNVLVVGYHHPLEIAKRYGTLDQVSGGRLILGLGVGSLRDEFELLGADFEGRGSRADDAIRALRASLSRRDPQYQGTHFQYAGVVLDPHALQDPVPLWIGGRTARSLRRAVEVGDAWAPFGIRAAEITAMLSRARDTEAWSARRQPLEVVLRNGRLLDPASHPEGAKRSAARLVAAGATGLQLSFVHTSVGHYLEQLEAMSELLGS